MRDLDEWLSTVALPARPWLLLGKGPTFSRRDEFDLSSYNLFSLNHVVRELDVLVASTMSIRVVHECADAFVQRCAYLVVPRVLAAPGGSFVHRLEDCIAGVPALRAMDDEGRLVWYNYEQFRPRGRSPVLLGLFSVSEASVQVLVRAGAKTIATLGIDGGTMYSSAFSDIQDERLAAGAFPYDGQFRELNKIRLVHGIEIVPLVPPEPGSAASVLVAPPLLRRLRRTKAEFAVRRALRRLPSPVYSFLRGGVRRLPRAVRRKVIS